MRAGGDERLKGFDSGVRGFHTLAANESDSPFSFQLEIRGVSLVRRGLIPSLGVGCSQRADELTCACGPYPLDRRRHFLGAELAHLPVAGGGDPTASPVGGPGDHRLSEGQRFVGGVAAAEGSRI